VFYFRLFIPRHRCILALDEQDSVRGFYLVVLLYIFHHVQITVTCFYYAPSPGHNRRMLRRVVVTIVFYFIKAPPKLSFSGDELSAASLYDFTQFDVKLGKLGFVRPDSIGQQVDR
jgi:hypothetical protein